MVKTDDVPKEPQAEFIPALSASKSKPVDAQERVESRLERMDKYLDDYRTHAQNQVKSNHLWARVFVGLGGLCLIGAIVYLVVERDLDGSSVYLISGVISLLIAGIFFAFYGRALGRLDDLYQRLDRVQRFLLADHLCEGLKSKYQQAARAELVSSMADVELDELFRALGG